MQSRFSAYPGLLYFAKAKFAEENTYTLNYHSNTLPIHLKIPTISYLPILVMVLVEEGLPPVLDARLNVLGWGEARPVAGQRPGRGQPHLAAWG